MIRKIWSFPLDKPLLLSHNKVLTSLIWLDKLKRQENRYKYKRGTQRSTLHLFCKNKVFTLHRRRLPVVRHVKRYGAGLNKQKKGSATGYSSIYTSVNKPICGTVRDYCGWKYFTITGDFFAVGVRERWSRPWRCPLCVPIRRVSHNKIITSSRMLPGWRAVKGRGRGGKRRGGGRGADISTVRHLGSTGLYSVPAPRWSWSECKCRRRCRPGPRLEHRERDVFVLACRKI